MRRMSMRQLAIQRIMVRSVITMSITTVQFGDQAPTAKHPGIPSATMVINPPSLQRHLTMIGMTLDIGRKIDRRIILVGRCRGIWQNAPTPLY